VNKLTLVLRCGHRIGRADIEESKSGIALNAPPPQASYPCGNFSDTSSRKVNEVGIFNFTNIKKPLAIASRATLKIKKALKLLIQLIRKKIYCKERIFNMQYAKTP